MITTKTSKLKFTTMTQTRTPMLLMLSCHLRQAGILLNLQLFPIKILLKQCKRLFSPLKAQRDIYREVLCNETILKYCANVFIA